ncbi:hypothetical protein UJ101_02073 [Flavobacteriaceae bacterium UJ101]|nr:hypothetical protein UJ101_02073 [Flavobacteriaceae bacterium UJ101]
MKQVFLVIGGLYGMLSVIFGALGSHALKKVLPIEKLDSFEIGVRYQMYHAIVLLFIGMFFNVTTLLEKLMGWFFVLGVFCFSFSIYALTFAEKFGYSKSFLGPITPIGGFFMIMGWFLLIVNVMRK